MGFPIGFKKLSAQELYHSIKNIKTEVINRLPDDAKDDKKLMQKLFELAAYSKEIFDDFSMSPNTRDIAFFRYVVIMDYLNKVGYIKKRKGGYAGY